MFLPTAVGETAAGHHEDQHQRIEKQDTSRHHRLQLEHHQSKRYQQRTEPGGEHDALQVDDAGKAPQAAVQAKREEDRPLQRDDPGEHPRQVRNERFAQIQVEAEPVRDDPCERDRREVVAEGEPCPPVGEVGHREGENLRQ
jgi:hypothetical protein